MRISIVVLSLLVVSCSDGDDATLEAPDPLAEVMSGAEERKVHHQLDLTVTTPLSSGMIRLYRYMDDQLSELESWRFDQSSAEVHLGYEAPASSANSIILLHVITAGLSAGTPDEYVCFAQIDHSTSRHSSEIDCGYFSTVAYYLAASRIGRSGFHPFHDISERFPLWQAIANAKDNDLIGFYVSIFATLQNALVDMGSSRFDLQRHSVRPVMESIVARFIDHYQRNGSVDANDLLAIANRITDHSLPLDRLSRYQTIWEQYAHIAQVVLQHTGGSLTARSRHVELLTMDTEVRRFFTRDASLEMSDFRTHIVQNLGHSTAGRDTIISWDPIPHMYGYNTYLDGEHIGFSRYPQISIASLERGTVTVKAVGYAGEFDGVHHDLSDPTLLAGADRVATN